ncbi:hypothetical protein IWW45_008844 [Coemansia sp. RSA 485]|nr:hypothetical protein IWW45_008844 [Coemansia sp. RSA 485]
MDNSTECDNCVTCVKSGNHTSETQPGAHPISYGSNQPKPKGILKRRTDSPEKSTHLRWDEDNIRITEAQKDSKMKVDEPKTPYIRYDPDLDADLQEMEELKLTSEISSRSSSVMSSPKRAQVVVSPGWTTESEGEDEELDEEGKARHKKFLEMRSKHYHAEGKYVHNDVPVDDSDESLGDDDDEDDDDDDAMIASDGSERKRSNDRSNIRIANGAAAKSNGTSTPRFKEACDNNDKGFGGVDEANASNMEL